MVETVLITGATGIVGSEIMRELASVTLIENVKNLYNKHVDDGFGFNR